MHKNDVLDHIRRTGLIPVMRVPSADDALALGDALYAAGLDTLEVPLTVPGGVEVIAKLAKRWGTSVLVGAGTVLDAKAAAACIAAGATFIISPGLDLDTVAHCRAAGVAVMPGGLTPTEIMTAWKAGADMVKVFPASAVGGASYLRAVRAPLPQIQLVPTGGVSLDTAAGFIEAGAAALGVGGDLVDVGALRGGKGDVIGQRARQYLDIVRTARAK